MFENVEIFWINCSSNKKRHEHMKNILEKNFPKNKHHHIEAVMHNPKYQGVTMAHSVALLKGIDCKKHFLILEDDVTVDVNKMNFSKFEDEYNKLEEIPEAIYFGLSTWGTRISRHQQIFKGRQEQVIQYEKKIILNKGAKCVDMDNKYFVRIEDMFGAHAILYISREYAVKTLKHCILAVELKKPHDIFLPKILKKSKIIGLREPWFYQLASIGGQEKATKLSLNDVKIIKFD